ncbi:TetR/AcrR family transcriptional regulator [Microbacterium mangrovi]|uniref:TetR/AcrR family transcriptional regulator n=1 Tax=Microbacterium mangrovi TaxID=1348253 RepID=UPI000AC2BB41|nr:TetR/AcrR family transcriptional regulator [Microbacterium mangrovi]
MSSQVSVDSAKRLTSEERREQILQAALAVFGARGYVGTTTDQVAKAAGVSQPYVVRLFGSKEDLFLAALSEATDELLRSFRAAIATDDGTSIDKRIGTAYVDLLRVRGLHQTMSHAYLLGSHPVIGPIARRGFARVWRFFRDEAGFDADKARSFLAEGMLINTMIGLRLVDDYGDDESVTEMFRSCFPSTLPEVLDVVPRSVDPW